MSKPKITITVDGVEFEIGEVCEFSDSETFRRRTHEGELSAICKDKKNTLFIADGGEGFNYIRKLPKPEPLTAEEMYRACGNKGLEVLTEEKVYGVITGVNFSSSARRTGYVTVNTVWNNVSSITHFRKAYSRDPWQPISELGGEA